MLGVHWKDWCWSWNSNTLATSFEELTHWKRPWCWEGSGAGGEGDDRGWDGWMASPTRWTWVWVNSGSWWWSGRPGVLQFMGSQRVGHDWATELNWSSFWSGWLYGDSSLFLICLSLCFNSSSVRRGDQRRPSKPLWEQKQPYWGTCWALEPAAFLFPVEVVSYAYSLRKN